MTSKKLLFLFQVAIVFQLAYSIQPQDIQGRRAETHHRFRSLDRIRNRLGGNRSANWDEPKDEDLLGDLTPYSSFNSMPTNGLGNVSSAQAEPSRSHRGKTRLAEAADRLANMNDDSDDDDDDSYEDEEDEDVLSDNVSSLPAWNSYSYSSYKNRLRSRYQPQTTSTTTTTTTTTTPAPPTMSYSQYKWQQLSSRQGVEQLRNRNYASASSSSSHRHHGHHHNSHRATTPVTPDPETLHESMITWPSDVSDTAIREAINHAIRITKEGSCGVPKPRLVRIQDFYPDQRRAYLPHCTILYQCSDETGCCRQESKRCAAKSHQRVELAFYVTTYAGESTKGSTVERLTFYNHTECECRDRMDDIMPRDGGRAAGYSSLPSEPTPVLRASSLNSNAEQHLADSYSPLDHRPRRQQCRCSTNYAERILPDGSCSCDCFDKQKECLRLKRGKDFFSMQDKWCIKTGRCEVPACAYGSFIHIAGRCPRKREKFGPPLSWHRYLTE